MKMRSTIFLTLSLAVHAVCITALTLSHFKSLESPNGNEVEVTLGESSKPQDFGQLIASNEVMPDTQPVVKPIEKIEVVKPLPKPLPKKEVVKEKKIVKAKVAAKPATTLPAKEKPAVETEPESMNPQIEDTDAVAVAEAPATVETQEVKPQEEAPKFIPVKEKVSAEADEDAEVKTEASQNPAPTHEPATSGQKGGESKTEAVSYLDLTQYSGNKPPVYPMSARKDSRQGSVDLLYRVTKEGRVAEVQVHKSSGHPDLDEAAVKAVAKYKFVPGQDGWAKQPVIFTLKGEADALPSKLRSNSAATE